MGFARDFDTDDTNGQDLVIRQGAKLAYYSYGFYAQYINPFFDFNQNAVDRRRYGMSLRDIGTSLESLVPLPPKIYPTAKETDGLELGVVTLKAISLQAGAVALTSLLAIGLLVS